jgi:hypothetical protein
MKFDWVFRLDMQCDAIIGIPKCVQDNGWIIVVANVYAESQSTDQKRTVVLAHDFATSAEKPALSLMKD